MSEEWAQESPARVAVVTGAGSGIGRSVARAFLDDGYRVAVIGRREEALRETVEEHSRALVLPAEVSRPEQVSEAFAAIRAEWGRIDVLFNNAGVTGEAASFDETNLDDWMAVVSVNLNGVMFCAREAFRVMREQKPAGGRIINNGSLAAHTPRPQSASYTATKHAVTGLTKSIELDGRPFGISASQIDIGNAATQIAERLSNGPGAMQPDGRRMPEPTFPVDEVARAVLFVANCHPDATVSQLTIMARGMPFVGRG